MQKCLQIRVDTARLFKILMRILSNSQSLQFHLVDVLFRLLCVVFAPGPPKMSNIEFEILFHALAENIGSLSENIGALDFLLLLIKNRFIQPQIYDIVMKLLEGFGLLEFSEDVMLRVKEVLQLFIETFPVTTKLRVEMLLKMSSSFENEINADKKHILLDFAAQLIATTDFEKFEKQFEIIQLQTVNAIVNEANPRNKQQMQDLLLGLLRR